MQASNAPSKSAVPFAKSGAKTTIPVESQIGITPGAASFTDGFPPLTRTPLAAGGVPPYGADFNGILNFLSSAVLWNQAGGTYQYDAAFSASIGGYPKGAVLLSADATAFWVSSIDANTSNPDAVGAGWFSPLSGRLLGPPKVYATAGTFSFTPHPLAKAWHVLVIGAGAGTGGVTTTAAGESKATSGAGAGGESESWITTAFASATVIVGVGGVSGTAAPTNGGNGSPSSFSPAGGVVMSATGGTGTPGVSAAALMPSQQNGSTGGVGTGGNIRNSRGGAGSNSQFPRNLNAVSGGGGASSLDPGGASVAGLNVAGNPGKYGSGAGGCIAQDAGNFQNGAVGGDGYVIIKEYA